MAQKNNIRSIRISDDMAELIDRQAGANFTEKWENLVTRYVWELPHKERQLKDIDMQLLERRKQLERLSNRANAYAQMLQQMENNLFQLEKIIARAQEHEV